VDDTQNFDNDANTDKYVHVAWADASGQWPSQVSVRLFTSESAASATADNSTTVNFTSSSTSSGWTFESTGATVSVDPSPVNDAPTAANDSPSTNEDASVMIDLRPLASDVETADADLTYNLVSGPSHGTLNRTPDGQSNGVWQYSPFEDWNGTDSFQYSVTDRGDPDGSHANPSDLTSPEATIRITVDSQNDPPIAAADTASVEQGGVLNGPSVLVNDDDSHGGSPGEDNLPLTARPVTDVSNGSLTFNNVNGMYTYVPNASFIGVDSFTYEAVDSLNAPSDPATVTIYVGTNGV